MKIISIVVIIWVISMGAISCTPSKENETKESPVVEAKNTFTLTPEQYKVLAIQTGELVLRSMSGTVKANGMLDVPPQNLVTISAPLGGFVKKTSLLQGMKIAKGAVVVEMEHTDYIQLQQDYLDSKSQLEYLELEYKRQSDLAKENVNAAKALQQSRSNYFSTKAKVEGYKARLQLVNISLSDIENGQIKNSITLYSPISGYVTQVNVNIGMYVSPAQMMFRIVDSEHVHAEAQVFEKDINKLRVGQRVRIRLSNEQTEREGKVFLIGKEITPERTVRVHCHLENHDPNLIPGMYFSAIIETGSTPVKTLPNEAVVSFNGKYYVFLEMDKALHQYKMLEIIRGITEEGFTQVTFPSDEFINNHIVIKGTYGLLSVLKNKED